MPPARRSNPPTPVWPAPVPNIELALSALAETALYRAGQRRSAARRIEWHVGRRRQVGFLLGGVTGSRRASEFRRRWSIVQLGAANRRDGRGSVPGTVFEGRVTALAPAADAQSRVFDVEVTIPNRDGRLRPGMIGTVALGPH